MHDDSETAARNQVVRSAGGRLLKVCIYPVAGTWKAVVALLGGETKTFMPSMFS